MGRLDAAGTRLVVTTEQPALRGGRLLTGVGSGVAGPAVLTVSGRRGAGAVGVRVVEDPDVPPQVLVASDALASRVGLEEDVPWRLEGAPATPLRKLTVEALVEEPQETLWRAIKEDAGLVGQCLWLTADPTTCVLEAGNRQVRVRSVDAVAGGLVEIAPTTEVELFVAGARVGLDVVVLADCSGSMDVDDLPVSIAGGWGSSRPQYRTRLDALKEALQQMLQARLRVSGRESQFALLRFSDEVCQVFPREEGMVSLDASAPPSTVAEFRRAVAGLGANGPTDVPEALLRAAELLDRYGRPDNDRLVVLVSDGKSWTPKTAEATGEIVVAKDDPVTLVEHLHKRRGIRFHAVGISNASFYEQWVRRTGYRNPTLVPDHPLLGELVRVGGGDPTRIGGIDVLEQYFSGLGAGLSRYVGTPRVGGRQPQLGRSTVEQLRDVRQDNAVECAAAVERLRGAISELNFAASSVAGRELGDWLPFLFSAKTNYILHRELTLKVSDQYSFENVLYRLHLVMVERGPGRRRGQQSQLPDSLKEIYDCFRPLVQQRLNPLRQVYAHDKSGGSGAEQREVAQVSEALVHYVGRRVLEPGDSVRWAQLRTRLLLDAAEATEAAVRRAWEVADVTAPTTAAGREPTSPRSVDRSPEDLSLVLDLRVRD